ncbi:MAG: DUF4038 domain-containing protein [Thermoguttaceae bacterium]
MRKPRIAIVAALATVWLAFTVVFLPARGNAAAPRLKVSPNGRFLAYGDGNPFFWLDDTAWKLFHRLNREEPDRYLENRARRGFTVSPTGGELQFYLDGSELIDLRMDRDTWSPKRQPLNVGKGRHLMLVAAGNENAAPDVLLAVREIGTPAGGHVRPVSPAAPD